MAEWDDLEALVNDTCVQFLGGIAATYTPAGGVAVPIVGIFMRPAAPEERTPGNVTKFWVKKMDLPSPMRRDTVTISGSDFEVDDVQDDESGGYTLLLRRK